jgi:hypothetical protein
MVLAGLVPAGMSSTSRKLNVLVADKGPGFSAPGAARSNMVNAAVAAAERFRAAGGVGCPTKHLAQIALIKIEFGPLRSGLVIAIAEEGGQNSLVTIAAGVAVRKAGRTKRAVMSVILFILGILVTAAGVVTIAFGIPINEFSLGNTLIVSGTTTVAAGLILIGLAAAVDQLTQITTALRPRAGARPAPQPQAVEAALPGAPRPGQLPVQAQGQVPIPVQVPVKPPMPAPPRGPVFARSKAEDRAGEPAPAVSAPEASSSAIERLRSSLARADQKAGDFTDAEDVPYSAPAPATPAGPGLGPNLGANGAAPTAGPGAAEAPKKPPLDFLFRSKSREPQPEPFDAVWPKRGSRRADEQAGAGEPARPAAAETPIDRAPVAETPYASAPEELRLPAILKSGVVDGMAYTLYADGSIEAQLPQGTVRFGSIAELRSHIENNS